MPLELRSVYEVAVRNKLKYGCFGRYVPMIIPEKAKGKE